MFDIVATLGTVLIVAAAVAIGMVVATWYNRTYMQAESSGVTPSTGDSIVNEIPSGRPPDF